MEQERGLFVVFEGIDGAGTSTQVHRLAERIDGLNKYQDVIKTHEPWKNKEVKRKLCEDSDSYSDPENMAELFISDRTSHTWEFIRPNLLKGAVVLTDRYSMSTCAYQGSQGMDIEELIGMHRDRGILLPDLTFLCDVEVDEAIKRISNRSEETGAGKEKFEDRDFLKKVRNSYDKIFGSIKRDDQSGIFGSVVKIDTNSSIEEVSEEVFDHFNGLYNAPRERIRVARTLRNNKVNIHNSYLIGQELNDLLGRGIGIGVDSGSRHLTVKYHVSTSPIHVYFDEKRVCYYLENMERMARAVKKGLEEIDGSEFTLVEDLDLRDKY